MRRVALGAAAVLGALLLLELGLRAAGYSAPQLYQLDPQLGWSLRAAKHGWRSYHGDRGYAIINAAGFRDGDRTLDKPDPVYRIAVLGDEYSEAAPVALRDTWWWQLEAKLQYCGFRPGKLVEVLNFGVAGANTPEHRHLVEKLLDDVHPDFILLQWYVNDVEGDDSSGRPSFRPLAPFRPLHNWLNNNSALYTVANMQWAETQVALGMTKSYIAYLHDRFADPGSADSVRDRELLNDLILKTQQAHVPMGIVLFPDTAGTLDDRYPFGYLHDRVLALCSERGITCLDLRSAFAPIKDLQTLWANRLDHHPSARANAIAAEKILETYSGVWAASLTK